MNETIKSGLLASGKYGSWSVEIEEITKGVQTIFGIIITYSMITLQFSIKKLSTINDIVELLSGENHTQYKVDNCLGGALYWIFDEGRLCIRQVTKGTLGESELFEVMLSEVEWKSLKEAMKDALEDL